MTSIQITYLVFIKSAIVWCLQLSFSQSISKIGCANRIFVRWRYIWTWYHSTIVASVRVFNIFHYINTCVNGKQIIQFERFDSSKHVLLSTTRWFVQSLFCSSPCLVSQPFSLTPNKKVFPNRSSCFQIVFLCIFPSISFLSRLFFHHCILIITFFRHSFGYMHQACR